MIKGGENVAIGYLNGNIISPSDPVLPIDERGHQFGDGVYEYIRVYNKKPFMMTEHLDRLFQSADAIRLNIGKTKEEIEAIVLDLIDRSELDNCDVYMQATRGIAPRNHLFPNVPASISMTVKPFRPTDPSLRESGISVKVLPDERWQNCWVKTLNLLPNLLAKQEAFEAGAQEAVLVRDGTVTEGSSSNVFIVKNGTVITPPATKHILHGITRRAVFQLAEEAGISVKEQSFGPDALFEADEVFMTSTSMEVMSVTSIDSRPVQDGKPGRITVKLQQAFEGKTAK